MLEQTHMLELKPVFQIMWLIDLNLALRLLPSLRRCSVCVGPSPPLVFLVMNSSRQKKYFKTFFQNILPVKERPEKV